MIEVPGVVKLIETESSGCEGAGIWGSVGILFTLLNPKNTLKIARIGT